MRRRGAGWWLGIGLAAVAGGAVAQEVPWGATSVKGLQLHATQMSSMWRQSANAFGKAMDAVVHSEAADIRAREEAVTARAHAPNEGVCEGIEGYRGLASARTSSEVAAGAGGDELAGLLSRDVVRAAGVSEASDARARVDQVVSRYCAPGRVRGESDVCSGAAEAHGADVYPGAVLEVGTFRDRAELEAAMEWVRNVALPGVADPPSMRGGDSAAAREEVLERRALDARVALAAGYLQGLVSDRVAGVDSGGWAAAVGGSEGGGRAVSKHELLRTLARGRYERPGYFARLQAAGWTNVLREWIVTDAGDLVLGWEEFQNEERVGAMIAARLSGAVERGRER